MSTFIGNTLVSSMIFSRKNSLHTAREDVNQIRKKENAEKGMTRFYFLIAFYNIQCEDAKRTNFNR